LQEAAVQTQEKPHIQNQQQQQMQLRLLLLLHQA
jgi:hypothetical protein